MQSQMVIRPDKNKGCGLSRPSCLTHQPVISTRTASVLPRNQPISAFFTSLLDAEDLLRDGHSGG
jgi:hypothetical protein